MVEYWATDSTFLDTLLTKINEKAIKGWRLFQPIAPSWTGSSFVAVMVREEKESTTK